jgi:redox-sensitive bicupin YhaK (pirin superfamily)
MTRLDADEAEVAALRQAQEPGTAADGPRALLLESREVPLGGVRAMSVHRSLPQRDLPLVGAWCFLDRFGPQVTRMRVEPHPHIGLQTVTWPFAGEIRHRDTVGSDVILSRGALNIMTSGAGIAHSGDSRGLRRRPSCGIRQCRE